MTGIENITGRIQADAQAEIDRIQADARREAEKIAAGYAARADREVRRSALRGEKRAPRAGQPPGLRRRDGVPEDDSGRQAGGAGPGL